MPKYTLNNKYVVVYKLEHIAIAEKALGKELPKGAQVHHIDGNKANNTPQNLIVCQDHAYHFLLHQRQRASTNCGNASWRQCYFCKEWDDPKNLYIDPKGSVRHRECAAKWQRDRYAEKKRILY